MLRKTLISTGIIALALIVGAGWLSIRSLNTQGEEVQSSWNRSSGEIDAIYEIRQLMYRTDGAINVAEQGQVDLARETVREAQKEVDALLANSRMRIPAAGGSSVTQELGEVYQAYSNHVLGLIDQIEQGYDVYDSYINALPAMQMDITRLMSEWAEARHTQMHGTADSLGAYSTVQAKQLAVYIILGVFAWLTISYAAYRLIMEPIRQMADAADAMAHGNYNVAPPSVESESLGRLRSALQRMAAKSRYHLVRVPRRQSSRHHHHHHRYAH